MRVLESLQSVRLYGVAHQFLCVHAILRQNTESWVAVLSSGIFPTPGMNLHLHLPYWQMGFLTLHHPGDLYSKLADKNFLERRHNFDEDSQ